MLADAKAQSSQEWCLVGWNITADLGLLRQEAIEGMRENIKDEFGQKNPSKEAFIVKLGYEAYTELHFSEAKRWWWESLWNSMPPP